MKSPIKALVLVVLAGALALPIVALADETTPAATPAADQSAHKVTAKAAKATPSVDLNAASKEELTRLPGLTDEIADKIIGARPFKSRTELLSKKLVTRAEYAKLRAHVMVKSAESKKS
ncbi:MAG TPA: helix-hairpin-helix domain-containing protein [Candidatus Eisenbacteria bacterium]|jgi:DNA uptake protein ComE-like DNA-binding protein